MVGNIYSLSIWSSVWGFFEDIWYAFYDTYINNSTTYENLDMNGMISVQYIIIGLFLGLAIAAVASVIGKRVHGAFVEKLLSENCLSEESAKTLPELDFADKLTIRYGVRYSVNLRRIVRCAQEEAYVKQTEEKAAGYEEARKNDPSLPKKFKARPFKFDLDTNKFYIPEDLKEAAETKFAQKGISVLGTVVFVAILAVAFVLLLIFLPNILGALDKFIGSFK